MVGVKAPVAFAQITEVQGYTADAPVLAGDLYCGLL
jgi:hypothetical protein